MESTNDILSDAEEKMGKAVEFLQTEFGGLRSGKASPAMVETITVDYYGTPTRLKDMSNISTPEPRLLVIAPYDASVLPAIEKAIIAADIGITPMSDGKVCRLPVPELSEERRKDLLKVAKSKTEEQRVAVRNVRRDANELVKARQKDGDITEDDRDVTVKQVQKLTDKFIGEIDKLLESKEAEVMSV